MHRTRNDLPARSRAQLEKILNQRLADAIDLAAAAKQAHWNVTGPNFIALHEHFDRLHASLVEHVDTIAERITALGGRAMGTIAAVARGSSLAPFPDDLGDGPSQLAALADRVADFAARVRKDIERAARLDDADTADLFTALSRDADKQLWLLEAHLRDAG